ncbi:MAG: hypothetical protein JNK82_11155 [Myxococcaceae bacterium]|nr:hypothetical protein [Myxococcaceae bacterium]
MTRLLAIAVVTAALAAAAAERPKLAFTGLTGAGLTDEEARTVTDFVEAELLATGAYQVVSRRDIETLLGIERQKQLLGCSDESCMAEIAGALDVDRALNATATRSGDTVLVTFTLLDPRTAQVVSRAVRTIDARGDLDPVLDGARSATYEVANADPAQVRRGVTLEPERGFGGFALGVAGNLDALGLRVAPAIVAELSGKRLGAALTLLVKASPGLRLEGRWYPLTFGRVRPYVGAGGVVFLNAAGVHVGVGAALRVWRIQLIADVAYERFLWAAPQFVYDAALVGLGAQWAF